MSTDLVPFEDRPTPGLVRPLSTPAEAARAVADFQALKLALLQPGDYQDISGKTFVKRSGWRRIALAFGIDCEIMHEERRDLGGPTFAWEITARAIAPNGRHMDATGACASDERRFAHPHHDVRAVAETRAKNRCISDLVAGGELSADEMEAEAAPKRAAPARSQPRAEPAAPPVDPDGPMSEQQLANIRAHLVRTGVNPEQLAGEIGVQTLEDLTVELAAQALRRLSREPNAPGHRG